MADYDAVEQGNNGEINQQRKKILADKNNKKTVQKCETNKKK